ncbi:MAG: pyruvate formate lyase family protein, partial [Clostridiales bacterium]|nr:pyruvate formate lyase family protein [Clostridiales bacterium]
MRSARRLAALLEAEKAVILPEDRIALIRTVKKIPSIMTQAEWDKVNASNWVFDGGEVVNISSDYEAMLRDGFAKRRQLIAEKLAGSTGDGEAALFFEALLVCIDACSNFARKYAAAARNAGKGDMARVFENISEKGASSFYEACQFFRLLNFLLWINGNHHITVGRFDQYMYPYYKRDIESGVLNKEEAYELLAETFLSLNKDNELYHGVQQGDNGQSLVLGGIRPDGRDGVNELTGLCLKASLEINLIDPKINLRVSKDTPLSLYVSGTELTKQGMGFPQYNNDDVVIPGLVSLGYDLNDARDYVTAACWEFIIPGKGMDIPNIDAMDFPKILSETVKAELTSCTAFEDFMACYRERIETEAKRIVSAAKPVFLLPSPLQSLLMDGCVERGRDISTGGKYNNYGMHGAGIATAVDGLYAIRRRVYEEKSVSAEGLTQALANNFADEGIRRLMLSAPRMGDNDDDVDGLAAALLNIFADTLAPLRNERGGIIRPGTGTAMYYLWLGS